MQNDFHVTLCVQKVVQNFACAKAFVFTFVKFLRDMLHQSLIILSTLTTCASTGDKLVKAVHGPHTILPTETKCFQVFRKGSTTERLFSCAGCLYDGLVKLSVKSLY